jgi:hypothetical protein
VERDDGGRHHLCAAADCALALSVGDREARDEEELADWRAGRNAIYQLAALTIGELRGHTRLPFAAGANSFTEAQAKSRIEKAGYTNVSDLSKDKRAVPCQAAGVRGFP